MKRSNCPSGGRFSVYHSNCNLLHPKGRTGVVTTSLAVSHGNPTVVTNVQLRLLSFASNLSGSGLDDSNATSEGTPNSDGHHPSHYPLTNC